MGKRKLGFLAGILIVVGCVFLVGSMKRDGDEPPQQSQYSKEDQNLIMNTIDAIEANRFLETSGNIHEMGEVIGYGAFEYQVTDFWMCESFEDITSDPEFREAGVRFPYKSEGCRYVGVVMKVTNRKSLQKRFYPMVNLILAKEGNVEIHPEYEWDSRVAYIGGFEYNEDDEHNRINPLVEGGETITLKLYFEYVCYLYNGEREKIDVAPEEVLRDPEFYIRIYNSSSVETFEKEIKKDKSKLYIRCYPGGGGA